jgi:hypothetical protein
MRNPLALLIALLSLMSLNAADSGLKRYLYLSTPDASQSGGSGMGILVFDIDDGHRFVRRIDVNFKEGLRGFCGSLKRHAVYYSTTNRRLGAFDLESEKVLWERTYDLGCDRACITTDGKKLYVPTGWWWKGTNSGFFVVDADNGDLLRRIPAGTAAHNSIASLDGQFVYLGTDTNFWVFRASDDSLVRHFEDVGEYGVFPFTIDSRQRYAYASANTSGSTWWTCTRAKCRIVCSPATPPCRIARMAPASHPMNASCGSAIRKAKSCSISTPLKCRPKRRATSISASVDMAG